MSEFREDLKDKAVRVKRKPGRKPFWGRLSGMVDIDSDGKEYFWVEREAQGGQVPVYREDMVIKRKDHLMKFAQVPATGRISKGGKALDRGKAGG